MGERKSYLDSNLLAGDRRVGNDYPGRDLVYCLLVIGDRREPISLRT